MYSTQVLVRIKLAGHNVWNESKSSLTIIGFELTFGEASNDRYHTKKRWQGSTENAVEFCTASVTRIEDRHSLLPFFRYYASTVCSS